MKKAVNIGLFEIKWVCLSPSQCGLEDRPNGYHARILYHNIGSTYNGQSLDLTIQKIHVQIPQEYTTVCDSFRIKLPSNTVQKWRNFFANQRLHLKYDR